MENRPAVASPSVWILAVVGLCLAVGIFCVLRLDRSGTKGSGLGDAFRYKIEPYKEIDPALIGYGRIAEFATELRKPRAVAVGPDDRIFVVGDSRLRVFDARGKMIFDLRLPGEPTCVAVAGSDHAAPRRVYVGLERSVAVVEPAAGDRREVPGKWEVSAEWKVPGENVHLTSIGVAKGDVFVADYRGRVVLRYDPSGEFVGQIGQYDKDRGVPGFAIPSPFFDVVVSHDGHLWVVNPGLLRLEAYSFEGRLELFWEKGRGTPAVDDLFGCCNPANVALLSDGRFVVAEKGLLRVKVYSAGGDFECVVAGPEQLDRAATVAEPNPVDHQFKAVDLAVDSRDRVVVLHLVEGNVQIFEVKRTDSEGTDAAI